MIEMLKLSDQEFKMSVINMIRALMNKVDNMQTDGQSQKKYGNPKTPKKKKRKKEMPDIKNTIS